MADEIPKLRAMARGEVLANAVVRDTTKWAADEIGALAARLAEAERLLSWWYENHRDRDYTPPMQDATREFLTRAASNESGERNADAV